MKKIAPILIGILVCLIMITISYFWAYGMIDSFYTYRSPLRNSPPLPGKALGSPNTRSLVIVLIDALRYDTSLNAEVMPYLNHLRSIGASAEMHSRPPSYSQPGYTVLLTGAWPDINDGPAVTLDYADIPTFTQDDIFSAAHRAGLQTAISGYNWFQRLVPQYAISQSFYTAGEDQVTDRQVTNAAFPWLMSGKYQLVLIHLDQVDYAGHYQGGPIDPRWNAAAARADGLLEEIAQAMDLTKDTLLVISDHGQIDYGGHGGQDAIVLLEPFVMVGKGVMPGKYGDIQMVDVAPTVAVILGTNIPATNEGRPRYAMFSFTLAQDDDIKNALSIQQSQLALAYGKAIDRKVTVAQTGDIVSATQTAMDSAREAKFNDQRLPRGIIAAVVAFLMISIIGWNARQYYSWMLIGVAIYLIFFNIKYLLIDHRTYSLSSVVSADNLISSTALTTLIALFIAWLFILLGTRAFQRKPRKVAEFTIKFILFALSILLLPVLVHYVINGATITWTLPNFLISFLGILFLIQSLIVAVVGLFLTGISPLLGYFAHGR